MPDCDEGFGQHPNSKPRSIEEVLIDPEYQIIGDDFVSPGFTPQPGEIFRTSKTTRIEPIYNELDHALRMVREEVHFATEKFGKFASPHEGYAIIKEELDELWEEVKRNNGYEQNAKNEAIQVAAMAVRYLIDISRKGIDTHG